MKLNDLLKKLNITKSDYDYIHKAIKREPNELELYLFSAAYSEHCGYRHSKKYLEQLYRKGAILTEENAGGVEVGEHVICFKMESHNHPSAIEPYNGAATGVGGIIRDILAMNARPIALTNTLKFGTLDSKKTKYLFEHVVKGISDYANCIGVPTITGETDFDIKYKENPLVNVMALGIVKKNKITTSITKSNRKVILAGSRTIKDGIGGAAFASKELADDEMENNRFSIQIADPFMKKKLIEATLEILTSELADACQDCGAAGILSSTGEIALKSNCGIHLNLDKVHLGDESMTLAEIMLSETQERMVFICEEKNVEKISQILKKNELEFSIIGETIKEKTYNLYENNELKASLPTNVLSSPPFIKTKIKKHIYSEINSYDSKKINKKNIVRKIYNFIANPNFASKEWVYSQYDYTVGNRTTLAPSNGGCSAIWLYEENCFLAIANHSNQLEIKINPFEGAINLIAETRRKLIAKGFTPLAFTNCLNFSTPDNPAIMGSFTETVRALGYVGRKFNLPVVSGNVSFYNECNGIPIYSTPIVSMIGLCDKQENILYNYFQENEKIYLLGKKIKQNSKIGGSLYFKESYNVLGDEIDKTNFAIEFEIEKILKNLTNINTCMNVCKGGLLGTLFKGLTKNELGFTGSLIDIEDIEKSLFGEIQSRYLISTFNSIDEFENDDYCCKFLGTTNKKNIEFDEIIIDKTKAYKLYNTALCDIMDK